MAVITLTSASGSPGVTTTALGWALSRGRPTVLVDADPTGGASMLAGYLRGQLVPPDALLELWTAQQQGRLRSALPSLTMSLPDSAVELLPGTRSHAQARALVGLWEPLLAAFKALEGTGQDVIVDVGRLGLTGSPTPLLHGADLALVVCRSDLVSLSALRSWLATLHTELEEVGGATSLGVVLVGPGRPYSEAEVGKVLAPACGGRPPVLGSVAWDPRAAAAFSAGTPVRRLGSSQLVAGLRHLDEAARKRIASNTHDLSEVSS
ncbi:ParA family protein [Ornithinimicrobium avium]|uniref:ParA family protein n=1 Tax=Ornithinimicrobium avium TaxID=2283195 RepID=A0A345NLW4_9MICO|nr:ParA family protein [Ornithinimicrobium avium]AXH96022.1 ParA family protein [Ornithinimicrobium avium]